MLIAALPPAMPPARVVAGVQVTWPLSRPRTQLLPGSSLVVRVSSPRRRARLSLVRVTAHGRAWDVVAAKTLRKGSFTVKVPSRLGARYALRLNVAGHKRWSWITTPAGATDVVPQPAPAPAPLATPTPTPPANLPFCGAEGELPSSAFRGKLQPGATTVRAGETLPFTIDNVGEGKLRLTGDVVLVAEGQGPSASFGNGWTELLPGASLARSVQVPAATPPGRYVLRQTVFIAQCDYIYSTSVDSEPLEVLP